MAALASWMQASLNIVIPVLVTGLTGGEVALKN